PADRRYPAAVSRRIPVCFSMRRKVQPSWPSAITCFCLSSLKTLLTLTEPNPVGTNVLSASSVGRFSGDHQWPVLGDRRGRERVRHRPLVPDYGEPCPRLRAASHRRSSNWGEDCTRKISKHESWQLPLQPPPGFVHRAEHLNLGVSQVDIIDLHQTPQT